MAIEFDCPACDATIRVKDDAAGKKGRCPRCKVLLLVPDPGPEDELDPDPAADAPADDVSIAEPDETASPTDGVSVLETSGSMSTDTLPVGPEAGWTPPADTMPLGAGVEADDSDVSGIPDQSDMPAEAPPEEADFPFIPDVAPGGAGSSLRTTHRARRDPTRPFTTALVAIVGLLSVMAVGWFLYRSTQPSLAGALTAERARSIMQEPASFAPPTRGVPQEDVDAVLKVLNNDGLPIRSEYVDVLLRADDRQVQVFVDPGPRSDAVRLSLGEHPGVQAALAKNRQRIADLKQQELNRATADLFRDYATFLEQGSAVRRLPEYRNQVALNAAVGTIGYAIEAIVSGYPFPCVHEDDAGNCYFLLPKGTTAFRVRGRELTDGSTPLAVDFEVTVVDAPVESTPAKPQEQEEIDKTPAQEDQVEPTEDADAPKTGGEDMPAS